MKVHHIGYVVKHIDRAVAEFTALGGGQVTETVYDPRRKVNILFLDCAGGGGQIELIEPTASDSVAAGLLKKMGASPYHICYTFSSLEETIGDLRKRHWFVTAPPESAPAIGNRRVAFLYHAQVGLIEILEENSHE